MLVPRISTVLVALFFVLLLPGYMIYRDYTRVPEPKPEPPVIVQPQPVDLKPLLDRIAALEKRVADQRVVVSIKETIKETKTIVNGDNGALANRVKKLEEAFAAFKEIFTKFQNIIVRRLEPPDQGDNSRK